MATSVVKRKRPKYRSFGGSTDEESASCTPREPEIDRCLRHSLSHGFTRIFWPLCSEVIYPYFRDPCCQNSKISLTDSPKSPMTPLSPFQSVFHFAMCFLLFYSAPLNHEAHLLICLISYAWTCSNSPKPPCSHFDLAFSHAIS